MLVTQAEPRVFGLDVLRAMAIILVLISHGRHFLVNDVPLVTVCRIGGFYGVELFFVLSGFLIGSILLKLNKRLESLNGLLYFWKRRWYRTLPNYYLFLFVSSIVSLLLSTTLPNFLVFLPFLQNFAWEHPTFFAESWSLAVEEWFYLLFPIGLYFSGKTSLDIRRSFLLLSLVFLIGPTLLRYIHVHVENPTWDQGVRKIMVLRLDAIMFGMLAAWVKREWPTIWPNIAKPLLIPGLILIGWASWLFLGSSLDQSIFCRVWLFTIVSFGFVCFIPYCDLWTVSRESFATAVFRNLALWSYSLYLSNSTIFYMINRYVTQGRLEMRYMSYTLFFIISLALSALCYRYFEKPVMDRRDRLSEIHS